MLLTHLWLSQNFQFFSFQGIMGPLICIQNFTELLQTQPSTLSQKADLLTSV